MASSILSRTLVGCVAIAGIAGVAQGATVRLQLCTFPSGTWRLTASASLGDNAGISGFNIFLVGLGDGGTSTANAPKGFTTESFISRGFTVGNGDDAGDFVTVFAGQVGGGPNLDDPATILFGVGQTPGTIPGLLPGSETGVPWDAPVLLAFGTGDWEPMSFGESANVNVFTEEGSVNAETANVILNTLWIPEPSTFALTVLAFLAVVGMRRTRWA